MSINMYVINAILILMVVRQIREHPLGLRSMAAPVLAVLADVLTRLVVIYLRGHRLAAGSGVPAAAAARIPAGARA